ncbi:MAG TPA: GMC family oxidoreductase [Alphaproteobacteria bacterium]|nr:GMC family oxidoreductase [Alphaproteobacteria bacterium]
MFFSADEIEYGSILECDLCIVGSGAAGLTVAREFCGRRERVLLLESGGFDLDPETQALYECEVMNPRTPPLTEVRLRFFGGTTNHWTGTSRPLDELDFHPRAHVASSGWPFALDHLTPYYRRAAALLQIEPSFTGNSPDSNRPLAFDSPWLESDHYFRINPLRFAQAYRDDIASADNIRVVLDANVLHLSANPIASRVETATVATLSGRRFSVKSSVFVLATGGVENARILLNSDDVEASGLGNRYDNVGRYYQDHPNVTDSGQIAFTAYSSSILYYLHRVDEREVGHHGFFWPTPMAQEKWGMLNCGIWLMPIEEVRTTPGLASLRHIGRKLGDGRIPDDFARHLLRAAGDIDGIFATVYRKLAGVGPQLYTTWFWSECAPDRDSRVTLTSERDALGQRRARVDWRIPDQYVHTYRCMYDLLAHELGRVGLARVQINNVGPGEDPREHVASSAHHMGTTRMHVDPKHGVVDANCRVHGIENLFVAGSSVFPTYGQTAATYTIVALALRLADHLKQGLS